MIIRKVERKKPDKKKKVAAYARVSTTQEEQEESFESQVAYFTEYIKSVENWEMVKVYADEGISGLSAAKRAGFMEMIEDAKKGKIDLILVKSISRFARNSLEAQQYMHLLKSHSVEIRFEREDISSFDPQAEMIFNFLVVVAQEESKSISENIRWTYAKLAERGIRHIGSNHVFGYDEVDGKLTPNDDAKIVKMAFEKYAEGMSIPDISELFDSLGFSRMKCNKPFDSNTLLRMFNTEIYVGDRVLQKSPHLNWETKKPDPTIPYTSYYLKDDHEGIVSREVWDAVHRRLEAERNDRKNGIYKSKISHFLYGKIICGECGKPFKRITISYKGKRQKCWKCADRMKGKNGNGCMNITISEKEIFEAAQCFDENDFDSIERIEVLKNGSLKIVRKEETNKSILPIEKIPFVSPKHMEVGMAI